MKYFNTTINDVVDEMINTMFGANVIVEGKFNPDAEKTYTNYEDSGNVVHYNCVSNFGFLYLISDYKFQDLIDAFTTAYTNYADSLSSMGNPLFDKESTNFLTVHKYNTPLNVNIVKWDKSLTTKDNTIPNNTFLWAVIESEFVSETCTVPPMNDFKYLHHQYIKCFTGDPSFDSVTSIILDTRNIYSIANNTSLLEWPSVRATTAYEKGIIVPAFISYNRASHLDNTYVTKCRGTIDSSQITRVIPSSSLACSFVKYEDLSDYVTNDVCPVTNIPLYGHVYALEVTETTEQLVVQKSLRNKYPEYVEEKRDNATVTLKLVKTYAVGERLILVHPMAVQKYEPLLMDYLGNAKYYLLRTKYPRSEVEAIRIMKFDPAEERLLVSIAKTPMKFPSKPGSAVYKNADGICLSDRLDPAVLTYTGTNEKYSTWTIMAL